jgi:hypothetical protein
LFVSENLGRTIHLDVTFMGRVDEQIMIEFFERDAFPMGVAKEFQNLMSYPSLVFICSPSTASHLWITIDHMLDPEVNDWQMGDGNNKNKNSNRCSRNLRDFHNLISEGNRHEAGASLK